MVTANGQQSRRPSIGLAVQQLFHLEQFAPVDGETFARLNVQLFQLLFTLVDGSVEEFTFLLLFDG